jgi:streptomycin 6-kinase
MFVVPDSFVQGCLRNYGADAEIEEWLGRLPDILEYCQQHWNITIQPPFANLSFHYVVPALQADRTPVVLKVHAPTGEFEHESTAIKLFAGHGMVRLLDCDADHQVMLLERLQPGRLLKDIQDDEKATSYAAGVMRRLWRPAPVQHPFPTVQDWGKGFERLRTHYNGGCGPFPPRLLDKAETLFAELSASMAEPVLLHGDLHHENILSAERQPWLAIDPKGLIGEPAYETGDLLRNQLPKEHLRSAQTVRMLRRRIDQLAEELTLDRQRVRDWGIAQAVLAVWWGIEDSDHVWAEALACAEMLATIKV